MLALFCGTASLPHILIRYYTVKDQISARKSTVVGIAAIGFFYVLTLFLGLGAMTSGNLDVTDSNMSAPLLARSLNEFLFAVLSAVAFTTVLGTVSGLIMAASGAVAHDLMTNFMKMKLDDFQKVRAAKIAALCVGLLAICLGILFAKMNVNFLVGWAFNIAASANLPALVMLLFWKRTTKQGITAAIIVGMISSLAWILLSAQAYKDVYGLDPARAIVPFSQPAIVTIPLGLPGPDPRLADHPAPGRAEARPCPRPPDAGGRSDGLSTSDASPRSALGSAGQSRSFFSSVSQITRVRKGESRSSLTHTKRVPSTVAWCARWKCPKTQARGL